MTSYSSKTEHVYKSKNNRSRNLQNQTHLLQNEPVIYSVLNKSLFGPFEILDLKDGTYVCTSGNIY
jgi:hypothetical protein